VWALGAWLRGRPPDFAQSSETPGATSGKLSSKGLGRSVMFNYPTPGGEPLGRVPGDPARFVLARMRPKLVAAGGSREWPSALQLFEYLRTDQGASRPGVTLGSSREPPV
jgi:hypothetical protein